MIERFIPAFYQDTFSSEADAIDATSLDTANLCAGPLPVNGGGKLFVFEKTALIVLPAQKNQYELWLTGVSMACATADAARAALDSFKSMRGVSSWRVFERKDN